MGRRGRPIVLDACRTCKIRRIKCDGSRPSCRKCFETGRICDGFPSDQCALRPVGNKDKEELRSFVYFSEKTSLELSGHYDESFWRHQVFQISSGCPALHHLVVAIGALHESLKQTEPVCASTLSIITEPVFALQQCNKAIKFLVGQQPSELGVPVLLTSSILFMAFDILQNRLDSALHHLRSASRMLDDWEQHLRSQSTSSEREVIDNHIGPMISRFRESADIPGTRPNLKQPSTQAAFQTPSLHQDGTLSLTFFNLSHASVCLHNLVQAVCGRIPEAHELKPALRQPFYNNGINALQSWRNRFKKFLQPLDSKLLHENRRRICLLDIHFYTVCTMFPVLVYKNEMLFDDQLATFKKVVKACQQVIDIESGLAGSTDVKMSFSFDLGIISPLYFAASRCRDPCLRREAVRLLISSSRREGFWLSWVTGLVANQIVMIEEKGLQNPSSCRDIPLENRIQLREMHYDPCPVATGPMFECFTPVLYIKWTTYQAADDLRAPFMRQRSIQLPATQDKRPGQKPYWVIMPNGTDFSLWKLLLGRKVFDEPASVI